MQGIVQSIPVLPNHNFNPMKDAPEIFRRARVPVHVKPHHAVHSPHELRYRTFEASNPPSTSFSGSKTVTIDIERDSCQFIDSGDVIAEVTVASANVTAAPFPLWFEEVSIHEKGQSQAICTLPGEYLFATQFLGLHNDHQIKKVCQKIRANPRTLQQDSNYNSVLDVGTHKLQMSLHSVLEHAALDMGILAKDIQIKFKCRPATYSGTETNLTLDSNGLKIRVSEYFWDDPGARAAVVRSWNGVHSHAYLTVDKITHANQTLTAGTEASMSLEDFDSGRYAAFMVCVTSSDATSTRSRFENLGDASTWDIKKNSQSVWAGGTPRYGQDILCDSQWPGVLPENCYVLSFGDLKGALMSQTQDGFKQIDAHGTNHNLSVTPVARVSQVWTATVTGVADGGSFAIALTSENGTTSISEPIAYNAAAADIKTALEAMPAMTENNNEVTCSGAGLVNARTWTFTKPIKGLTVSLENVSTTTDAVFAETTEYVRGISTSGGSYVVNVYGISHARLSVDHRGSLWYANV